MQAKTKIIDVFLFCYDFASFPIRAIFVPVCQINEQMQNDIIAMKEIGPCIRKKYIKKKYIGAEKKAQIKNILNNWIYLTFCAEQGSHDDIIVYPDSNNYYPKTTNGSMYFYSKDKHMRLTPDDLFDSLKQMKNFRNKKINVTDSIFYSEKNDLEENDIDIYN
jgi:hypothetical protein